MRKTRGFSGFRRSRRGNTLLVAILFSAIVIFGVTSYVNVVSNEIPQQAKRMDRMRALEIADAGLEHALWFINDQYQTHGINWWIGLCDTYTEGPQTDDAENYSPEGLFPGGERYEVDIDQVSLSQSGRPTFFVRSSGYITRDLPRGGTMDSVKTMAVMTRPEGFSDYARFVATGNLSYGQGAIIDGNVHVNGTLSLNGTVDRPIVFRRRVAAGSVSGNVPGRVYFQDELKTGVSPIPLPDTTTQYATLAQSGGIYYAPPYGVTYATIDLSTLSFPADFNGIIYCTKSIKVSGKPTRPITIVAGDDIRIMSHIPAADDPRHVLGLIAKDQIQLDSSTPNNLQIHAAIMAIQSNWEALGSGSKYGLTIKGSIVTKTGGNAGPYLAGERHYVYDRRLMFYMPPMYPDFPGGSYVLVAWMEAPGEADWRDADLTLPDLEGLIY